MRRVHWTLDLQEAEILAGLLRAEGIDAFVFDTGIVRINWNTALAYGGYRVMVPPYHQAESRQVLTAWRQCEYALPPTNETPLACPHCGSMDIHPDRRRRGWTFVLFVMFSLPMPWT